jgi:hypothetical protein
VIRILGVDFSGASDAGRKIWIAEGRTDCNGALGLRSCVPAIDLPGGGLSPGEATAALVRHVAGLGDARVGCDFPFSLPRDLLKKATWRAFALRYSADYTDAEAFRASMRARPEATGLKRATDRVAKTPFDAHNLRLYRQTWWGIAGVLAPLVAGRRAVVQPQQSSRPDVPSLIEICPASTLKSIGLYSSYKGKGPALRKARGRILDHLVDRGVLAAPARRLRTLLLENQGGDALDAVIGAVATAHADLDAKPSVLERLEGRVYYEIG